MKKANLFLYPALVFIFISGNAFISPDGYEVGSKAKSVKLKNVDGKMVSFEDYPSAKGFIVIFTCNHCPFSKAYEDRIIALHEKYAAQGFPVIAINPNDEKEAPGDSFEEMAIRAKEKNFPFPYLHDATQSYAKAYGAARTPHVYVLAKNNKDFVVEYIGAIDNNTNDPQAVTKKYLEDAVNELMAGKKVTNNFTKAIGCTIKWKKS